MFSLEPLRKLMSKLYNLLSNQEPESNPTIHSNFALTFLPYFLKE